MVLPAAIGLALTALVGYAMRDVLLPAKQVEITRAVASSGQATDNTGGGPVVPSSSGTVVAQAPGWIEPDPYPVFVISLANGVVDKVHVLEGQAVKADQLLVELIADDAALALDKAKADLALSKAAYVAAETEFNEPVGLKRAEQVAIAEHAGARAALARLDAEVTKERARLAELEAAYRRLAGLKSGSVSALEIDAAKYKAQSQRAALEATKQRRPELEAMVNSAAADLAAAKRDLELKTELRRKRDSALAAKQSAAAVMAEAELRLKRMKIYSPIDGVVMLREVSPGSKVMLHGSDPHSSDVVHLYRPDALQVRVDVPISDAASVGVGQRAIVVVDVLPDTEFTGVVTRVVHQADIAKNTVQFKVALDKPSPLMKPDMLARVKFFGAGDSVGTTASSTSNNASGPVLIERSAVVEAEGDAYVWWVSPADNRVQRRAVDLGRETGEGLIEIRSGLNPADIVVNNPDTTLKEGLRVRFGADR